MTQSKQSTHHPAAVSLRSSDYRRQNSLGLFPRLHSFIQPISLFPRIQEPRPYRRISE